MNEKIKYEILFIEVPDITSNNESSIENQIKKVISDNKADLVKFDRWGKFKLAYTIKHYEYGIYFLIRFNVDNENKESLLKDLKNLFAIKYSDLILRELLIKLPHNALNEYKRPESLEDKPKEHLENEDEEIKEDIIDDNEDLEDLSFQEETSLVE